MKAKKKYIQIKNINKTNKSFNDTKITRIKDQNFHFIS